MFSRYKKGLVSVIIPSYNRSYIIKESIESVLNQTYSNLELIIVDDGSTDNTKDMVLSIDDKLVNYYKFKENKGACAARNFGLKKAKGEYIAFQDSDDLWYPNKLEVQLNNMTNNNSDFDFSLLKIIEDDVQVILPTENQIESIKKGNVFDELCNGNFISTQTFIVKHSKIKHDRFDESLPRFQDWDFILRIIPSLKTSFTNELLVEIRHQKDSISLNQDKLMNALRIIHKKDYNCSEEQLKRIRNAYRLEGEYIMSNSEPAIVVKNVTKKFKLYYDKPSTLKERLVFWNHKKADEHVVLDNVNLEIKKGETVALIGVNGSGKSTLLKLMTKIIYPNKGKIETYGKLTSLLELGAGFHPDFTGRENIYFNASIFGLTKKEIDDRLNDIIEFSELGEFIDSPVRTYSSGMYMRLAFSVAINVDADILLIDEILAVGDQHFQDKCFAKLNDLKNSGKTIVIVSNSLDSVKKLCNRGVWISEGKVKADGNVNDTINSYLESLQ